MASSTDEKNLKAMKELLPPDNKIPDEYILEVLKQNGNDCNRAFDDLLTRQERSSWQSVDKPQKKKTEKQQTEHSFSASTSASRGRGRGRDGFSRSDSPRAPYAGARDSGYTGARDSGYSDSRGGRGGARDGPARGGSRIAGKVGGHETSANRSGVDAEKKPQPAAAPERPIPEPAPVPVSNQWAMGKPKIENIQEKPIPPPPVQVTQQHIPVPSSVASAPPQTAAPAPSPPQQLSPTPPLPSPTTAPTQPQVQQTAVPTEMLTPIDQSSASWVGAGQVDAGAAVKVPLHTSNGSSAPVAAHTQVAAAVGSAQAPTRPSEATDKAQDPRFQNRTAGNVVGATDTDALRNNFASLNVGQHAKLDTAPPQPSTSSSTTAPATNTSSTIPNQPLAYAGQAADAQQMQYSAIPGQSATAYGQAYPQYQYSQQFAQMQTSYQPTQETEDFSAGRMPNIGIGDASGYAMGGAEASSAPRGNTANYGGKGAHGKQVQPQQQQQSAQQTSIGMQQPSWQQAPLMNSYSNMMGAAAAMYSQYGMGMPAAAAQQMLYMQGMQGMQGYMGMPYPAGGIASQMYNSTAGYPAQQAASMGSKAPYNVQNPNKKQQQYANTYAAPGYTSAQYGQQDAAATSSQDFYKSQGAPAAGFQQNYTFANYGTAPMGVAYDSMGGFQGGQQQASQASYAGRGAGLPAGANGSSAGMENYQYYFPQTEDGQAAASQQWRARDNRGQV